MIFSWVGSCHIAGNSDLHIPTCVQDVCEPRRGARRQATLAQSLHRLPNVIFHTAQLHFPVMKNCVARPRITIERHADAAGINECLPANLADHRQVRMPAKDKIRVNSLDLNTERRVTNVRLQMTLVEVAIRRGVG